MPDIKDTQTLFTFKYRQYKKLHLDLLNVHDIADGLVIAILVIGAGSVLRIVNEQQAEKQQAEQQRRPDSAYLRGPRPHDATCMYTHDHQVTTNDFGESSRSVTSTDWARVDVLRRGYASETFAGGYKISATMTIALDNEVYTLFFNSNTFDVSETISKTSRENSTSVSSSNLSEHEYDASQDGSSYVGTGTVQRFNNKPRYTHFISIPLNEQSLQWRMQDFQSDAITYCAVDSPSLSYLFQKPEKLHLTVCMLSVPEERLQEALDAFNHCKEKIIM
ncbi:unnamed protein product [Trichogramma brassicae]|uniref:A-kinase anchor protein 7-like phosphoesterase domain-containing protein n=1 Tax=Trichogramma brassicae TaxID=86971 RepID=A0A6H5IF20_9HYME|nr:unnamed protein product [Trichogramma brassicae]